ncbi:MAG: DMT family transporter [Ramlibacter sp.]|nr:DMT family transporter [Ramlibacter sp.]
MSPLLPVAALMLNALVWGLSWWPFRALEGHGLHPLWSTALIYAFSLVCLLLARPGAWSAFARHPLLWLLAAAAGLTNVGFNWAVTVGDVVRVVLLFYLMPAWSVLLAWPLLGEKPTAGSLLRLLLALTGVVVVLKTGNTPWPVPEGLADWLALMGGFSFALTNILLLKLSPVPAASRVLAMFAGGALMASLTAAAGMAQGLVTAPPAPALPWLAVALALGLAFLVGNLCLQYGASRLAAHTTALVMLSEVVFASVSSVAAGAAQLTSRTLLGGALILLAAGWSAWPARPPG